MKFWRYNLVKVLAIGGVVYVLFLVPMFIAAMNSEFNFGIFVSGVALAPLLPAIIAMAAFGTKGAWYFKSMDELLGDNTENSVMSAFENECEVVLRDENSRFHFTSEQVKTTIQGLPVTITYSKESRTKRLVIVFAFYPLSHPDTDEKAAMSTSYYVGFRYALPKDMKPRLLQFVEDLKQKGYSAGV